MVVVQTFFHPTRCQGHPAGERDPQGQNRSPPESCCPHPAAACMAEFMRQSWVSCLSACALTPQGQGPRLTHISPPQPQTQQVHRPHAKRRGRAAVSRGGPGAPAGWNVPCWRLRIWSGPDPLQGNSRPPLPGRQTSTRQL